MSENEQNDSYNDISAHIPSVSDKFFQKISRISARLRISYGDIGGMIVRARNLTLCFIAQRAESEVQNEMV
ncbi:MAG TPA: hypothetical protein DIU00_03540 [Phycisphaerales bacterium]|nr:hypothetical protein [Phycisphaerales bacterium]